MSILICSLTGVMGRSIKIYDRKCEITTDLTLSSVITKNATDGTKTIFYIDCIGLQFKKAGLTVGYLQFETASSFQNNSTSNFFNENTFTYENGVGGISDILMEDLYHYLSDIIESYKYNDEEMYYRDLPDSIAELYGKKRLVSDKELQVQKQQQLAIEEAKSIQAAIEAEKMRKEIQEKISSWDDVLGKFFSEAEKLNRYAKIKDLWVSLGLNLNESYILLNKAIEDKVYIERMYGPKERDIVPTLNKWKSGNI